jgi:hypothetical protein
VLWLAAKGSAANQQRAWLIPWHSSARHLSP